MFFIFVLYVLLTDFKFISANADKPGPPENLHVTSVDENSVGLVWEEPSDDGGTVIEKYIVSKREASRRTYQAAGDTEDLHFTVEKLTEGMQYVFQVAAENECGVGEPVELSQAVTAKSPHGKIISTALNDLMIQR